MTAKLGLGENNKCPHFYDVHVNSELKSKGWRHFPCYIMRVQFYLLNRASPSLLVLHGHESDACGGEEVECVHEGRPHDAEGGVDAVGDHGLDEGLGVGHEVGAHGRRSGGVVVVVILGDSDGLGQLGRRRRRRPHCGPGFNTNSDKEARKSVHIFFPKIVQGDTSGCSQTLYSGPI